MKNKKPFILKEFTSEDMERVYRNHLFSESVNERTIYRDILGDEMKCIFLFAKIGTKVEDENVAGAKPTAKKKPPVKQTAKRIAEITKETKKELKAVLLLPPTPFEVIVPSMGLSKMNSLSLYRYCVDKFPRVLSVPAYVSVNPSIASLQLIADALFPYTGVDRKISDTDKINRALYMSQLSTGFTLMAYDAANKSLGNKAMFALTKIATRKKAVRNYKRLPAPEVKLNSKQGAETLKVSCKKIPYATSYTIIYGVGLDQSLWKTKSGAASQLLEGLTSGDLMNVIMWANTGKQAGYPSVMQSIRVPY